MCSGVDVVEEIALELIVAGLCEGERALPADDVGRDIGMPRCWAITLRWLGRGCRVASAWNFGYECTEDKATLLHVIVQTTLHTIM